VIGQLKAKHVQREMDRDDMPFQLDSCQRSSTARRIIIKKQNISMNHTFAIIIVEFLSYYFILHFIYGHHGGLGDTTTIALQEVAHDKATCHKYQTHKKPPL